MNIENEPEFLLFDSSDPAGENNDQYNLLDYLEQNEPITLLGPDEFCQICFQYPGYHYADVDRLLFVCDDCYNRNFSIDLVIPPPIYRK